MSDGSAGSVGAMWAGLAEAVGTGLGDWHTAHPTATFAELEAAVEERLGALRAHLLAAAALRAAALAADGTTAACARCDAPLAAHDTPARTLRIRGNQQVRLRRPYLTCPTCGYGVFPPG